MASEITEQFLFHLTLFAVEKMPVEGKTLFLPS
jgi:hypothetical protein